MPKAADFIASFLVGQGSYDFFFAALLGGASL